ncbi:MAG: hypothetical protein ACF8TS_02010 [Maioricimonas sp. JB049]
MAEPDSVSQAAPEPERTVESNVFFSVVIVFGALFVVTVLISIAIAFGDPRAPANQWVNRHLTTLLGVEVVLLIVAGLLAMVIDRVRTLSRIRAGQPVDGPPNDRDG